MKSEFALLALLFCSLMEASALAQSNGPRVVVTAPRIGGGDIVCRGDACAGIVGSMTQQANLENLMLGLPIEDGPPLRGNQFCASLKGSKPNGCSFSSPPPSPGISVPGKPIWQANGCGTGGLSNMFLNVVLNLSASNSYSGSLDAPHPGVSFLGACNAHDRCYAEAGSKSTCDLAFNSSMESACGSSGAACMGWAHAYHGAVSVTNAAQSAYSTSSATRVCAVWAMDMRENSCPP